MSRDWVKDINDMQDKFGVHDWMKENPEKHYEFLKFRLKFIQEEIDESFHSLYNSDPEETVDALIDMCVVAIGTLDAFGVDAHKAWDKVLEANMAKEKGMKASRPNSLGLPDLVKPEGWVGPDHTGNHGLIGDID